MSPASLGLLCIWEELDDVAHTAAFEALFHEEHHLGKQQGVPVEVFTFRQVTTALRDFLRREWAYAKLFVQIGKTLSEERTQGK